MKDYEHVVIWLDYFNKTLSRSKGRKLEKEKCIFDPSLKELTDAAQAVGFVITESDDKVRFPRRPYVRSGYIVLPKGSSKTNILNKISEKLVAKRAKQSK
jgi:signal recognition particle subunit SRP19